MFSSALKSISATNITGNYSIASTPTSTAGPWKIYDAKKKSTGKAYSVFVFDRKALDAHGKSMGRGADGGFSKNSFKHAAEAVVERLKKEASSLARLRHPSVLELVEPVEETRGGGLQFATEAVTASLSGLLREKDEQERSGGVGGRSSRYVTEDADGVRRRRELEIDELEIQKGLLQLGKALEFLHENAGLVHGNLTPDAVLVNAKGDWKISGLSFCAVAEATETGSSTTTTTTSRAASPSFAPVSVQEMRSLDPRLPPAVQLNLDFASPDLVLDKSLTPAADLFSLGLLCIALYNTPHRSPLACHASLSEYKRLFASSSSVPSASNGFLCQRPLPRELAAHVLPRLITRRPAQRMTAREFQTSEYFDNILVSTIRFLDAFPAKTHGEKSQFLRGLVKVLPSFPRSVMEKKVLPALLDEIKDRELAPAILQNVFKIVDLLPSSKRAFADRVLPGLKEHFLTAGAKPSTERDPLRDASLMVVLEHLATVANNTGGKEFKDDILPIIALALESSAPSVVDAALRSIPVMLPVLDFSTIKHELFPVVGTIFSKTSSLAIKIRGLQAFVILCGGSPDGSVDDDDDGLDGLSSEQKKGTSSSALDKYTMQEKIVPLVKAIKTKEPAVMMEALRVMRVVGRVADADFVAMDMLPILWTMSLGPLLNLKQFQAFMKLIRALSTRVEEEQVKKLQELSGIDSGGVAGSNALMDEFSGFTTFGGGGGGGGGTTNGGGDTEDDFESLVKGRPAGGGSSSSPGIGGAGIMDAGWDAMSAPSPTTTATTTTATSMHHASGSGFGASRMSTSSIRSGSISPAGTPAPTFSWSTPSSSAAATPGISGISGSGRGTAAAAATGSNSLTGFPSMVPSATQFSQALPARPLHSSSSTTAATTTANPWSMAPPPSSTPAAPASSGIDWSSATTAAANPWGRPSLAQQQQQRTASSSSSAFSLPPPPGGGRTTSSSTAAMSSSFSLPPPPGGGGTMSAPGLASMGGAPNYNRSSLGMQQPSTAGGSATMGTSMGSMNNMGMGMGTGMGTGMGMGTSMGMGMNMNMMNANSNNNNNNNNNNNAGLGGATGMMQTQPGKTGLDKYASLL